MKPKDNHLPAAAEDLDNILNTIQKHPKDVRHGVKV